MGRFCRLLRLRKFTPFFFLRRKDYMNSKALSFVLTILLTFCSLTSAQTPEQLAQQILSDTGVTGGLVVHYGCGGGQLTSALHDSNAFLVQGLDASQVNVDVARSYIRSLGLYGKVTIEKSTRLKLPYIDNLVNLIVSEEPLPFDANEILRVLAPNGIAYVHDGNDWITTIKPRPDNIDDWTHYLYDASNNAVAQDSVVGPPRRLQWIGSPKWARQHDFIASVNGHVSANGRLIYIMDEGSKVTPQLPPKWNLVARDAFNGTVLWRKPIQGWLTQLWPNKSGPAQIPRRLVAVGDRIYITLGLDNTPVSAVDAVTGQTLWTSPATTMTEELIYSDGVVFALVKYDPNVTRWNEFKAGPGFSAKAYVADNYPWDEQGRLITALDANDGSVLWQTQAPVAPMTLGADANGVYFHDGNSVVCLDRTDGSQLWKSGSVVRQSPMPNKFGPTLVINGDYVLFVGGDANLTITGLYAKTGQILWQDNHDNSGYNCPHDLFVAGGRAWAGHTANTKDSGIFTGWDPNTGNTISFPPDLPPTRWMHQRCYRSKATERYILTSRNGIEFVDHAAEHWEQHHWTRGGCAYGFIPANGLIYTTPHNCACYMESMTFGFSALAAAHADPNYPQTPPDAQRLYQGPAYGEPLGEAAGAEDWPTYRCDPNRGGCTASIVPGDLKDHWETQLPTGLTTMTIANRKLYVASKDTHQLFCLDDTNGIILWSFDTGARVDSPPSIYKGRVIFGSNDGYVYCLRSADGALIWRFQAAPDIVQMPSMEQLESLWPVPGSVLIQNDIVYCVAGRNMFVDGGLRLLMLDPVTGNKISENIMDDRDPVTGENLQVHISEKNMPVSKPDILLSDGQYIYMKTQRFDMAGNRQQIANIKDNKDDFAEDQYGPYMHLFSPTGLLDDEYMIRTYWVWGMTHGGGASAWHKMGKNAPAGRVLAISEDKIFGYGRRMEYFGGQDTLEYHIFCAEKYPESESVTYHWNNDDPPMMARAIALADRNLFVAGPPDLVDEDDAYEYWAMDPNDPSYDPNIPAYLAEQDAAFNDERGAILQAVSATDGSVIGQYDLESIPVWDGMIAANGNLYIAMNNGKVKCFTGANYPPRIDAGSDRNAFPMGLTVLDANVTDDGIPAIDPNDANSPPLGVTANWTKLTGPGDVNFTDPNSAATTASFSTWGRYELRLSASDGAASYDDEVEISVLRPGDLDGDGDVDLDDLYIFLEQWLSAGCDELNEWCLGADQAAIGSVDLTSYVIMSLNWLLGVEPAAPQNLEAIYDENQIFLDWDDNTEQDLAGYNVYRSLLPNGSYTKINPALLTDSNFIDNDANDLLTYFYVVAAEDDGGYLSPYSAHVHGAKGIQPGVKLIAGIGVTEDANNKVSAWDDLANDNDATQVDDVNKPLYIPSAINGHAAIEFNGSDQHLDVADSSQINTSGPFYEKTLFVVFKTGDDVSSKQLIWEQGGGKKGGLNFYIDSNDLYINGWAFADGPADPNWGLANLNTPIAENTTYLAALILNESTGNFKGFLNGVNIGTYSSAYYLPTHGNDCALGHVEGTSRFHNGGHKLVSNFKGLIAEFYQFNQHLLSADRGPLEDFLMTKYAISP
jgi:outer membrane protein assembly factor BamB